MIDSSVQQALANVIEINVITYNRAPYLERTLNALIAGPFGRVRITILDNCSTDATLQLCNIFETKHSNLKVIRHEKNIGAVGNVLRAMELSASKYTWLLCDDDILDFNACDDLVAALLSDEYGLMIVGSPGQLPFEWGLRSTFKVLLANNPRLFHVLSFLPSMIFKTSLLDSMVLQQAYLMGGDMFPHLALAGSLLSKDIKVLTTKRAIVRQDYADPYWWSQLEIFCCWVRTCRMVIPSSIDRRKVIYEMASNAQYNFGPGIFLRYMLKIIALEKAQAEILRKAGPPFKKSVFDNFVEIIVGCTWDQRVLLVLCCPLLLIPNKFYFTMRSAYRWIKYTSQGKSPPALIPPASMFAREPVEGLSDSTKS